MGNGTYKNPVRNDLQRKTRLYALALCCAIFFGLGMLNSAVGPNLPEMAARNASNLATLGAIFTALFLGGLLSQLAAGSLNDRFGERPMLLAGLALPALGNVGLATSHWLPLTLASALASGLGSGIIIVSAHVLIADVFAERSVATLNLLNVFYGVGAIVGPAFAGIGLRIWGTAQPPLWFGIGLYLLLVPFVALLRIPLRSPHASRITHHAPSIYYSPLLWALGALLLVYVGTEVGVGGWAITYVDRTTALGSEVGAIITSGFWLALTSGRILGALLGTRLGSMTLLLVSAVGGLAGGLLLASSTGNAAVTIAAMLLLGLCFGPVFPTIMAITNGSFRSAPGRATSVVASLGSAGGMVLPWLQGVLLVQVSPSASVQQVGISTLGMLGLYGVVRMLVARIPTHDFFTHKALDQLIAEQGTKPVADINALHGDFWPEGESAEEFVAQVRAWREERDSGDRK